jgi:hypothetical protein
MQLRHIEAAVLQNAQNTCWQLGQGDPAAAEDEEDSARFVVWGAQAREGVVAAERARVQAKGAGGEAWPR